MLRRLFRRLPERPRRAIGLRRLRKWLAAVVAMRRHNRRLPATAPVLNFYPHRPAPNAKIYAALALLGMRAGHAARADQPTIAWDPYTVVPARALARLPANAINRACVDVRKSVVDAAWANVAGYGVTVDPLTWTGPLVVKSEDNGMHDGRLVEGPLARRRAGFVYQRFIDTREGGRATVQRCFVVGSDCPLVLDASRPERNLFEAVASAVARPAAEVFSAAELELILRFAAQIGMEYGEIDVVRDRQSGLIYAVDANRTPLAGPGMRTLRAADVYEPLAAALARLLAHWQAE